MAKTRSPNYPSLTFREAIVRARTVWDKELQHLTPKDVVAKALGYSSLNGASLTIIAALLRYGLLEQGGDQLRVSDNAVTVFIKEQNDPERNQAIQLMAFAPAIFSELHKIYGENLPSTANLTAYLVRKGFTPKSAGEVIRTYRDTLDFVRDEVGDVSGSTLGEEIPPAMAQQSSVVTPPTVTQTPTVNPPPPGSGEEKTFFLSFKISEDSTARVELQGPVTREAVEKLIAYLDLSLDTFPSKERMQRAMEAVSAHGEGDG
jgi:hypothetical protein